MAIKPMLIVDDEPIVRESIRDWLRNAGYQVETAETGEEAVLDIGLPGLILVYCTRFWE